MSHCRKSRVKMVYPRVGGGNASARHSGGGAQGLSPRGRGKLGVLVYSADFSGSIPAWAGETHARISVRHDGEVYPRVGGGNAPFVVCVSAGEGLSPRGRGKRHCRRVDEMSSGSIPAWAGETARPAVRRGEPRVYPRVGGGNTTQAPFSCSARGLSPRGRGKP